MPDAEPMHRSPGLPQVTVRTARPGEGAVVAALLDGGAMTNKEDPADVASYEDALAEIGATAGNDVLVAELDGEVVGTCQLLVFRHIQQRGGRCAEIESVHVADGHRSAGIGAALITEAVRRAREAGCYRVQCTSNKVRTDAHRFWARQGFEATHEGFKLLLARPAPPAG